MARNRSRKRNMFQGSDKGRNYYETTSPFETQVQGTAKAPATWTGVTDRSVPISSRLINSISGPEAVKRMEPEQYDNPRGYPGLSMVTSGDEKSKLGKHDPHHSLQHHMEGAAKLARTGK